MAFCPKCGKEVAEEAKFCTSCGTSLTQESKTEEVKAGAAPQTGETLETPTGAQTEDLGDRITEKAQELMNTPDTTAEFDPADIEGNKVLALLSYLGILWLIPLLAAPNSRFAKFHTNQGMVLWISNLIVSAVAIVPILGWIAAFVGGIITFVLMIIGIINAAQGKAKQLPIIGKFTILK